MNKEFYDALPFQHKLWVDLALEFLTELRALRHAVEALTDSPS